MRNVQIICDLCLKDITDVGRHYKFLVHISEYKFGKRIRKGDICDDCMNKFIEKVRKSDMRGEEYAGE